MEGTRKARTSQHPCHSGGVDLKTLIPPEIISHDSIIHSKTYTEKLQLPFQTFNIYLITRVKVINNINI